MSTYNFPISGDGRPVFTSNGIKVLFASGSDTQVTMLEPEVLKEKFGAELVADNVKLNPYYQVGECVGSLYKLAHFPIDGTDYDYSGLYVFNYVPSDEYKKACMDPSVDAVGKVCDIIISGRLLAGFSKTFKEWSLIIPDNIEQAVENANKYFQRYI